MLISSIERFSVYLNQIINGFEPKSLRGLLLAHTSPKIILKNKQKIAQDQGIHTFFIS